MYYCRICDREEFFKLEEGVCPSCWEWVKVDKEKWDALATVRERYLTTGTARKPGESKHD